jgi:hypothetical protein
MDDSALYLGVMTRGMLVLHFAAVEAHGEIPMTKSSLNWSECQRPL